MNVLIGCEFSGVVRRAFRALGHNAWSCDLLPAEDGSPFHIKLDVLHTLRGMRVRGVFDEGKSFFDRSYSWDMAVFHPPCTYLCGSGLHWNTRRPERAAQTEAALAFVQALMDAPIPRIAIENPVGLIGTRIRPADQWIQPYMFGDDASKKTGLWLKNLPKLVLPDESLWVPPRIVDGKKRWSNQTDSGQNKLGPSDDRWALRSATYGGLAHAMAEQWGSL